jgi:iron complex outermembrane receptor protein
LDRRITQIEGEPNVFRKTRLAEIIAKLVGGTVLTATCVTATAIAQTVERVEVTGSSIRRSITDQQSLPVSVYSIEELKSTGVASTEEVVSRLVVSQSSTSASQSIGSSTGGASLANLRGLGANKTLVLLNGRRLAFFGFSSSTIDLNSIPFASLERVEVLRDGASAIYGTDAVGGVINFITRSNYSGVDAAFERTMPQQSGGASTRISLTGGFGDLSKDGYNLWVAVDRRKQESVGALERDFAATGYIPSAGLAKTSGTTFPANFNYVRLSDGKLTPGNPTGQACKPPGSIYLSGTTCRFDYTSSIDIIPETEITTLNARGTFKVGGDKLLTFEAVSSRSDNIARIAPDPVTGLTMPTTSPFFPKTFAGIDPTKNLSGIGWRMVPAGQRENKSAAKANRFVVDLNGSLGNWDYRVGVFTASSEVSDGPSNGYVSKAKIQSGIDSGQLNPFGDNSAAALDYINSTKALGTFAVGEGTTTGIDARLNRDLFALGGGNAVLSLGAEFRREGYSYDTDDALVTSVPSAGRSPYHVDDKSRRVSALMSEVLLPVTKQLELTAAARYDNYSDFGSTFNPKAGFRFTVSPAVIFRGSANTGYRAPSLDEIYGPQARTFSANAYNDPVLCPSGSVSATGLASRDCGQQVQRLTGGNQDLKPEKSRAFTIGTALQPAPALLLTIDYWKINLTGQISEFPEQTIFADLAKYGNRIIRCNTLSATDAAKYERCNIVPGAANANNAIAYVRTLTDNLGEVRTDGIDITAAWATTLGGIGRLNLIYDLTWVRSYEYQRTPDSEFVQNVGRYVDSSPVFRAKHFATAILNSGSMRYSLGARHLSGYSDENLVEDKYINRVKSYTLVDLGASYSGIKNLTVGLVVKNVFNEKPPFTNQGATFQVGYDPRYTDPLMRTAVVRVNYRF